MYDPYKYCQRLKKPWLDRFMRFLDRNTLEIAGIVFMVALLAWAIWR